MNARMLKMSVLLMTGLSFPSSLRSEVMHFSHLSDLKYHLEIEALIIDAHRKIGNDVVIENMPLARSYTDSNNGHLDGLFARVAHAENQYHNLIRVPEPVAEFNLVLVINTNLCRDCRTISDMKKVATVIGFASLQKYLKDNNLRGRNLLYVSERKKVFRLMHGERVDGMIVSDVLVPAELKDAHPEWLFITLQKDVLYHYLHKSHEAMVPILSETIKSLKRNNKGLLSAD